MKKVAIIGIAGFGRSHLQLLLPLADAGLVELAAAVVRTPAKVPEGMEQLRRRGTKIYPTAEEFFAAERGAIDLVCIPAGIDAHEPLTVAALAAGMNVLLEKPAAGSADAVERMMAAEKASGKFVAVAFQHGYAPEIQFFKRLLRSGRFGRILGSATMGIWPRGDVYYSRNSWVARRAVRGVPVLDSPINNAFAHYLNLLLFLNGPTLPASARATAVAGDLLRARPGIEMFDACDLDFTLDNHTGARVMFAHCSDQKHEPELVVRCEKAVIRWHNNADWTITGEDGATIAAGQAVAPNATMFRVALDRLDHPQTPVYTLANALEHTRCVELADRTCPVLPVPAAPNSDGVYCAPDIPARFAARFQEP